MMTWGDVFTLQSVFAMCGGLLGALWATEQVKDGWLLSTLTVLIGAIFAAAVADYFLPPNRLWLSAGVGVFAGVVCGHALDALKAAAPNLAASIIDVLAGQWLKSRQKQNDD